MLEKGINLTMLERRIAQFGDVSHPTLSACVNGTTDAPKFSTFGLIAKGLGVDIVELFCTEQQAEALKNYPGELATLREQVAALERILQEQAKERKSDAAEAPQRNASTRIKRTASATDHPRKSHHSRRSQKTS